MLPIPTVLTVSQLNTYIKSVFDGDRILTNVYLSGEISNFTDHYRSGHLYMSLKDSGAIIKAVMFKYAAQRLRFQPESGMKVICRGKVSVFERDGQYQLYIEEMQPDGVGALQLAFEQTKKKLEALGYFDPAHKRPLPLYPKRIAVITSPTGAARRDIEQVVSRRYPVTEIVFCPVLVQGEKAPAQLIDALHRVNENRTAEVIILGRGGGSFEELFAFNDALLAEEIFRSDIPVISAVGHETDYTICDFVADVRAATPSVAAELATPDRLTLYAAVSRSKTRMLDAVTETLDEHRARLDGLQQRECMKSPALMVGQKQLFVDARMERMTNALQNRLEKSQARFAQAVAGLEHLSPLHVLSRGYAITFKEKEIVRSAKTLLSGDILKIQFSDGACTARVEEAIQEKQGEGQS